MKEYLPHLDYIKEHKEKMTSLLQSWANINSGTYNLVGLSAMLLAIEKEFTPLGGSIQRLTLQPQKKIGHDGEVINLPLGNVLSVVKRPEAPFRIFLGGHMDTVYSSDSPFQKAEISDKTMRGPGVADMKGGLLVLLFALKAFERTPLASKIGWEVLINSDEEIGSVGSVPLLEQSAKRCRLGLIFEPSLPDGAFVSHRKGSSNMTIIARGKSAHVGRDFHSGRNAIHALGSAIHALATLNDKKTGTIVNIGHISGGGPSNIVADFCLLHLNVRATTSEEMEKVKKEIDRITKEIQNSQQVKLELIDEATRPPKPFNALTEALFNQIKECAETLEFKTSWRGTGGVCDGNILSAAGLPTIDTLGVIGGNIHTIDEYVELDSLTERACLTALFLMKVASEQKG